MLAQKLIFRRLSLGRSLGRSLRFFSDAPATKVTVLYGSQTGTAKGFAQQLRKDAKKKKLDAQLFEMDKYDTSRISKDGVIVFVTSCFGEGEPPDNAKNMYDWLMSDDSANSISDIPYCVFGLGQSKTYPDRYQAVGKAIDKRMYDGGAIQLVGRGEGDDAGDIEDDFEEWCDEFFGMIKHYKPPRVEEEPAPEESAAAALEEEVKKPEVKKPKVVEKISVSNPYISTIKSNYELFSPLAPAHTSCGHIEFDITGAGITYETGDYLGVFPQNYHQLVKKLAVRIGASLSTKIQMEERHPTAPRIPNMKDEDGFECTLKDAFTHYFDLTTPPRRSFLRALGEYATDETEKQKILFMTSDSQVGKEDYGMWVQAEHRDVLAILTAFPSIKIPATQLCGILPTLQNRFYSICSSPKVNPTSVSIAVTLASHTPISSGMPRAGVCSAWLLSLMEGDNAHVFVKESLFRLPADPEKPIVMVGAGAGIAPFRAFVQERSLDNPKPLDIPHNFLIFGCNNRKEDFIFENDLMDAVNKKKLHLELACSFEQSWYIFVQHRILEPKIAETIWKCLKEYEGSFFVCGDGRYMAKGVHKALVEVVQSYGDMSAEDAETYLSDLQAENRYTQDVF